jgi:hypothetical protein
MAIDPFDDKFVHLRHLPDYVLVDIARNDAAQKPYRLLAVEILQARKSPKIQHPDLQHLVKELAIELDGIVFDHPAPEPGALKASFTTTTMFGNNEVIDNGEGEAGVKAEVSIDLPPTPTNTGSEYIGEGVVVNIPPPEPKPKRTYTRKPKEPVDAA